MKLTHLIAAVLLAGTALVPRFASAQDKPAPKLNHLAFYVVNLEKSTAFYRDLLNLTIIPEPFHDGKHTWFKLAEHSALHLIEGAKAITPHEKNTHLCFSVPSVTDMMALLDKNKVPYENVKGDGKIPTPRPDGVLQIYFQDPDGYWIEVNDSKQ